MLPNDGRVVSNFIIQALNGNDLTIYGNGTQTRSFCYVNDLIDGFIKLMNSKLSGPVNLGNPNEMSIIELAKIIISKVNPDLKIVFKKIPQDDPSRRKPDITLAKTNLDWSPRISLDNGLDKTINFFKKNINS